MAAPDPLPPCWRLTFRPLGSDGRPAEIRVRKVLKYALRVCGLRCMGAEEVAADAPTEAVLRAEIDRLRQDLLYASERVAAQAELLARRAEKEDA